MPYELVYTKTALRDIKKLDGVVKRKLARALERLAEKPLFYGKKIALPQLGGYRYRLGNHRVIFDIENKKVIILRVGHRSKIYR